MSENNHVDCFSSESLEKRLLERDGGQVSDAESYQTVDQYDPVLRAHCRLEADEIGPPINADKRR